METAKQQRQAQLGSSRQRTLNRLKFASALALGAGSGASRVCGYDADMAGATMALMRVPLLYERCVDVPSPFSELLTEANRIRHQV